MTLILGRRKKPENGELKMNNPFLEDYIRITRSSAFRRLAFKTQAISLPDNPHTSSRLVHTNEVLNLSLIISEQLGLNKELCMAIAAGHDIGHVPYGHLGERALTELSAQKLGENVKFRHNVYGVIIAQEIENRGRGFNLTHETLEGIFQHSRGSGPYTSHPNIHQEYNVVMYADKIAYLFSDLEDAIRSEQLEEKDVPDFAAKFGKTTEERKMSAIKALLEESKAKGYVIFEEGPLSKEFDQLKSYMYTEIYPECNNDHQTDSIKRICEFFGKRKEFAGVDPIVTFSLLTDNETYYMGKLLLRSKRIPKSKIDHLGVFEYLPFLEGKKIDYTKPNLDW